MDPAEKAHERRSEKAAQNAAAITSPLFAGRQTAIPLMYHKIATDFEEPGSFGFFDGRKRFSAGFCVRLCYNSPSKITGWDQGEFSQGRCDEKVAQNPPTKRLVAFSAREIALFDEK